MSLASQVSLLWTNAILRFSSPERLFELESSFALYFFMNNPLDGKVIELAVRYYTIDHLALEYRENIMMRIRSHQNLSVNRANLLGIEPKDYFDGTISKLNQRLYNVMEKLYGGLYT